MNSKQGTFCRTQCDKVLIGKATDGAVIGVDKLLGAPILPFAQNGVILHF